MHVVYILSTSTVSVPEKFPVSVKSQPDNFFHTGIPVLVPIPAENSRSTLDCSMVQGNLELEIIASRFISRGSYCNMVQWSWKQLSFTLYHVVRIVASSNEMYYCSGKLLSLTLYYVARFIAFSNVIELRCKLMSLTFYHVVRITSWSNWWPVEFNAVSSFHLKSLKFLCLRFKAFLKLL